MAKRGKKQPGKSVEQLMEKLFSLVYESDSDLDLMIAKSIAGPPEQDMDRFASQLRLITAVTSRRVPAGTTLEEFIQMERQVKTAGLN